MKSLKVTGLLFGALMFVAANAFADDLDATIDVMDMSDHAVENLMNPIDLPEQASAKAHDIQENSEHGLKTANEARARAAERIGSSDHSEDISESANDAADDAGDNASDAADDAADNASEAADDASDAADDASDAADDAADNASAAAAAAADNASEVASQVHDNAGL
jgi:methyl-accepting chemotaxis protein